MCRKSGKYAHKQYEVKRRTKTPLSAAEIGTKVGKIINRFKMGKHFERSITDGKFCYARREDEIKREAELGGRYVIRTSESQPSLSAEDAAHSFQVSALPWDTYEPPWYGPVCSVVSEGRCREAPPYPDCG